MKKEHCLNCGTELSNDDNYCPHCGQRNKQSRITIKELITDFLGDYFTFDSKLFRSLIPVILKPGFLTKEYFKGKRVRYIPPLRMYIFISIIYFFVMSINADTFVPEANLDNDTIQSNIQFSFGGENVLGSTIKHAYETNNSAALLDSTGIQRNVFTLAIAEQFAHQYVKFTESPEGFAPQLLKVASIMMFFIMPIFALILMLLYFNKSGYYIDHLIFSFHFHSFVFILGMVLYFMLDYFPGIAIFVSLVLILYYLYKSLRNVYGQKRFITIIKTGVLAMSGIFVIAFGFLTTMFISFLLF